MAKKKKKPVSRDSFFVPAGVAIPEGLVGYENDPPAQVPPPIVVGTDGTTTGFNWDDINSLPYIEGVTTTGPDGTDSPLIPPTTENFTVVVPMVVKVTPTGEQYIDVQAIVDDIPGVDRWEIRVTKI